MAQRAAEAAQRRATNPSEALLAQLLTQRALSLQERAQAEGVTAFLRRPVVRGRLNERFLQNTLRGVRTSNRRAEEAEMWELREAQMEREAREAAAAARGSPASDRGGSRGRDGDYGKEDSAERHRSRSRSPAQRPSRSPRSGRRWRSRSTSRSRSLSENRSPPRYSDEAVRPIRCQEASEGDTNPPPRSGLQPVRSRSRSRSRPRSRSRSRSGSLQRQERTRPGPRSSPPRDAWVGGSPGPTERRRHTADGRSDRETSDGSSTSTDGSTDSGSTDSDRSNSDQGPRRAWRRSAGPDGDVGFGPDAAGVASGSGRGPRRYSDGERDGDGERGWPSKDYGGSDGDGEDRGGEDGDGPYMMTDEEIAAMLNRYRVRGRGGVGSKADAVGPDLEDADEDAEGRAGSSSARRSQRGPEVPDWMRVAAATQKALSALGLPAPGAMALALQALQQGVLPSLPRSDGGDPGAVASSGKHRSSSSKRSKDSKHARSRNRGKEKDKDKKEKGSNDRKRRKEKRKEKDRPRDRSGDDSEGKEKDKRRKRDKERPSSRSDRRERKEKKSRRGDYDSPG